jgi:hypothetical protein
MKFRCWLLLRWVTAWVTVSIDTSNCLVEIIHTVWCHIPEVINVITVLTNLVSLYDFAEKVLWAKKKICVTWCVSTVTVRHSAQHALPLFLKFHTPSKGACLSIILKWIIRAVSVLQLYGLHKGRMCLLQTELQIKSWLISCLSKNGGWRVVRSLYDVLICPDKNCMNMNGIDMLILSREIETGLY